MVGENSTDAELIAAYLGGDCEGFNVLYRRYRNPLYSYLLKLMHPNLSQVDDVFQETWKRAIESLPRYKDNGVFLAWLMRIGYSKMIDSYRKRSNRISGDWDDSLEFVMASPSVENPPNAIANEELRSAIAAAIESLPVEQRRVFQLRMQNVKFEEIARIVGSPVNTCLARMRYALQKMKKFLLGSYPELLDKKGNTK